MITDTVHDILNNYDSETLGTKVNLARLLMAGKTGGTGKVIVYAVDQGFEHGPLQSFASNVDAHDPMYHFKFASEMGLSALAGPLGFLEVGAPRYAGSLPLILKLNSSNNLVQTTSPDQAITASIDDALRLGCGGVGFTFYPGSPASFSMLEELREIIKEAKAKGLFVVVWSYPRGTISPKGETGADVVAYGIHMACLMGAHIVKSKMPSAHIEKEKAAEALKASTLKLDSLEDRLSYMVKAAFNGRRLVVFSGGTTRSEEELITDTKCIAKVGAAGSMIGRNIFQRSYAASKDLVNKLSQIYTS